MRWSGMRAGFGRTGVSSVSSRSRRPAGPRSPSAGNGGSAAVGPPGRAVRLDRGAPGLQPGDRDAERRARHVVEADLVAEVHRVRVAAVLAADAELDAGARPAALLGRD